MTPERIGPYPIEREVGRGGMGVVYLGRDTRLERRVAIKVLPAMFAADPERLARFEREARLVASLNHPNIAGIYGIEEADGHRYLALEFVDGETLSERLARGPLSLEDTLDVCRQVAAALEAAHEGGVVHRDLKPGNIKVTPAGEVKVLDFGLAKGGAGAALESSLDLSNSPTLTRAVTGAGMILGTAAYMSPEQARGKAVDKRTDIWAFGCLLYECLTGRQAFAGETVSDMIARILQGEPEWNALPARTPERVRGLLRRCLEKDAKRRLRDIGDARMEIEDVLAVNASSSAISAAGAMSGPAPRPVAAWAPLAAVAVLTALATWFAARALDGPAPAPPQPSRFTISQPDGVFMSTDGGSPTLSPDGRMLAFVVFDSTEQGHVWLRKIDSTAARPLAGAETTDHVVFWSPDSRHIAFVDADKLKKLPVAGGEPEVICSIKSMRGGSWNRDGVILIALNSNGSIYRVPAVGGDPVAVTTLDTTRAETAHRFPQFLPDGRHFLFTVLPSSEGKFATYIGSLDSPERHLLLSAGTGVTWAPPGHLLHARDGKLMAQGFDPRSLKLRGDPVPMGDVVAQTSYSGGPVASASLAGSVAYATFQLPSNRMAWVELSGRQIAPIPLASGPYQFGSLSPDDRRVALSRVESPDAADIWIADLERGVVTRFTDEPGVNEGPQWSPDGTRIAWVWNDNCPQQIRIKSLTGESVTSLLESDPLFKRLHAWTPDGKSLIYSRLDPVTQWDIWILPLDGDGQPRPYLTSRFSDSEAQVSPDGRWLAYNSDESGQLEAYVQSFPTPGGKYQVTAGGGLFFGWSRDGRQLIYGLSADLSRAQVADVLDGVEFRLGPPRLYATPPRSNQGLIRDHAGQRFLALLPAGRGPAPTVTVVLDGLPAVSKR